MRVKDFIKAAGVGRKTELTVRLKTPWSDKINPAHVWEEYPRPQLVRDNYRTWNGYWRYAITTTPHFPGSFDGNILVPFSPESPLSGVERQLAPQEYLWYERTMDFPELPAGRRLLLHFGAVDQQCRVYINGKGVGSHKGGYLPFTFDITQYIREGSNRISVCVRDVTDSSYHSRGKQRLAAGGIFYTAQSGIWQSVWTEWVPEKYIRSLQIIPLYDEGEVQVRLYAPGVESGNIDVLAAGELVDTAQLNTDVEPGFLTATAQVGMLRPWTPETPFLYGLRVKAGEDSAESYFAMRTFTVEPDETGRACLCLNHVPYFQKGVLDQGYWPDGLMTAPCDEALVHDIRVMKECGFNMLRKHCKIENDRWYYHCDHMGMIVWQDMVNGGTSYDLKRLAYLPTAVPAGQRRNNIPYSLTGRRDKAGREDWMNECRETLHLLQSHPCIGAWVLFNEGWGQFDTEKAVALARETDSTRPIDAASGWFDQGLGDICGEHNYFRSLRVPEDDRAAAISEYGGLQLALPGHCMTSRGFGYGKMKSTAQWREAYRALDAEIERLSRQGLSASVYTQVSDIEEETNGIMTYDRKVCKLMDEMP